jgi:tetratricopeptide (TPR) repeat protein
MKRSTIVLLNDSYFDEFVQKVIEEEKNEVLHLIANKLCDKFDEKKLKNLDVNKLNSEELSLLGNLYYMLDDKKNAQNFLNKALEKKPVSEFDYMRAGNFYVLEGDGNKAYELLTKGKELFPENEYYEKSLFFLLKHQYPAQALVNGKGVLEKRLFDSEFLNPLIDMIKEHENYEALKRKILLRASLIDDKKLKSIHFAQLAFMSYKDSNFQEAKDYMLSAVEIDDSDIDVRKLFVDIMKKLEESVFLIQKLQLWSEKYGFVTDKLELVEAYLDTYLTGVKNVKDELESIKDKLYSQRLEIKWKMLYAEYYERENEFEKSRYILEELYEKYPLNNDVVNKYANVHVTLGDKKKAKSIIKDYIDKTNQLMVPYELEEGDEEIVEMVKKNLDNIVDPLQKASVIFKLGEYYDRIKDYKNAAKFMQKANSIVWQKVKNMPIIGNYEKYVDRIIANFDDIEWMKNMRNTKNYDKRPIFIIGMPRSGTTLVEQILKAGGVYDCGELTFIDPKIINIIEEHKINEYPEAIKLLQKDEFAALGDIYMDGIKGTFKFDENIFSDKQTHNFLHVGLIFMMFPNAKIINLRRDYRSITLSNYFIDFLAKKSFMAFSFDLEAFARELKGFFKLSRHWSNIMPKDFYKEVWYEDLVLHKEEKVKEIAEFCELEYTPELLEFYKKTKAVKTASVSQVRKPIYTSSLTRWKNYESLLQPVIDILGNEGTYKGL